MLFADHGKLHGEAEGSNKCSLRRAQRDLFGVNESRDEKERAQQFAV